MFNTIILSAVLMALWFIMSQKTEAKFLIIGAASSIVIAVFCSRILCMKGFRSGRDHWLTETDPFRLLAYLVWLIVQIVRSAVYVAKISLSDLSDIDPEIVWFRADYDSPFARALLANSITLTPGTITIDITKDGVYSVHALTQELKEGVLDGSMQQRVAGVFGEEISFRPLGSDEIPEIVNPFKSSVSKKYKARRKKA